MMNSDNLFLLVPVILHGIQAGAQLKLLPEKLIVLRGEEAQFTCTTFNTRWTVMVWLLNGTAVLTISKDSGVLPSINPNVTAERNLVTTGDSWLFTLKHTELVNQGQVTCDLQGIDRKTASLFVQERGSVKIFGDNMLTFKGQMVWFECRAEGWYPQPTLQWQVNDKKVSQAEYNISCTPPVEGLFTVTSNLSMTAAKSSNVDCLASVSALPTPLKSSILLTVVAELVQEEDACTVTLAVLASLLVLLLLLLCILTVFWLRQRGQARPSPQREIRFNQSRKDRVAEAAVGRINLGYSSEDPIDAVNSELENHSSMNLIRSHKIPDVVSLSILSLQTDSQAQVCVPQESSQNIRRITTV